MAKETMAYVVKRFYPYFWHKFKFPVNDDTESECEELVKNLRDAVWVHRIVSFRHWHSFVEMNIIPMVSSPEMYASCIFFMVSTTINSLYNRYETFMTTCSLVTAVAAYVYEKGYHEFLDYSPAILKVFFEEFHYNVFQKFKIWDHLHEYLINNNYSEAYGIVEDRTKGNAFADVTFQLDFVREISLKIKSKILFSEGAAVYHRTLEVLKCFETEGMSDLGMSKLVYGERFLHKVMKEIQEDDCAKDPRYEDVKKTEDESANALTTFMSEQSITKPETMHSNIISLFDSNQELKNLNLQADLGTAEKISETYGEDVDIKMCPSKPDEYKDVQKRIIGKEDSTMTVEKEIRDDCAKDVEIPKAESTKDLTISTSKQSTTEPETTHLNITSLSDLVKQLRNWNLQVDLGTAEETYEEDVDKKICPYKHQDVRKQIMEDTAMMTKREIKNDWAKEAQLEDVKMPQAASAEDLATSMSKQNINKPETIQSVIMNDCEEETQHEDVKKPHAEYAKDLTISVSKQSTTKPETVRSNVISLCDLIQEIKNSNLHPNLGRRDKISATNEEDVDLKTSIPNSGELQDFQKPIMEKLDATVTIEKKDAAVASMNRSTKLSWKELLPRWGKRSRITESEASACNREEFVEDRKKQVQFKEKFREACREWLRMEDCQESSSDGEELEEFNMKQAQFTEKFRQACREWLQIEDCKESAFATGETNLKQASTYQSENKLIQANATDKVEEKNMKVVAKYQGEEQFPQSQKDKFEIKIDDESAFKIQGAEKNYMEQVSEIKREKQLPQVDIDVSKLDVCEKRASSAQKMRNINLKQISANQSEEQLLLADRDILEIKDNKESAVKVEETGEANLKTTSTDQSNEQLHQADMVVLGVSNSKDSFSANAETFKIGSKPNLTDCLKKQLHQDVMDILKIKGKEQSASLLKEREETESDQAASNQSGEQTLRDKSEDSEKNITTKEENNFKRDLTDQSEEQISKDFKLIATDSKKFVSAAKKSETFLRQTEEQLIQNDLGQSKIDTGEESASTIECEGDLNASMDQSIEQFTVDDLRLTDDEQSAPVESKVGDNLSEDDCQMDAENLIEDEYSDTGILETKDESANTSTPKRSRRKRKRKSKPKQQKEADFEPKQEVLGKEAVAQSLVHIFLNSKNSLNDIFKVLEISRDD